MVLTYTIRVCPRCGYRHESLTFQHFAKHLPIDSTRPPGCTHHGTCPTTNEPILLHAYLVVQTENGL